MGLIQLHLPECEPISLIEAKTYLRIDHREEDEMICHLIRTARQAVESYTGRSLIRQAWRFTFNAGFGGARSDEAYLCRHKSRGEHGIELPRSPFIELAEPPSLVSNRGVYTVKDYRLDTSGRVAHLHFSPVVINSIDSRGIIQVDFWAGYGKTPLEVPEAFRHAILMLVAQLYGNQCSVNDNGFTALPFTEGVIQLIKPYKVFRL